MIKVTHENGQQVIRADEGGQILSDFIDRETGYRVVQVLLTIEGMNHIHMCTLNAVTGAIIPIQDRKPSLPCVTQETEGDLVCTNIRTRDLETGDEGIDQTLSRVGSDVDLYTYHGAAYSETKPESLFDTYNESQALQAKMAEREAAFKHRPRAEQVAWMIGELRRQHRWMGEMTEDNNCIFDPVSFKTYRDMAPDMDDMIEEILRGVFFSASHEPEEIQDARRRLGLSLTP